MKESFRETVMKDEDLPRQQNLVHDGGKVPLDGHEGLKESPPLQRKR